MYYINKNGELSSITFNEGISLVDYNFDTICMIVNHKKAILKDNLQNAEKYRNSIVNQLTAIDKDIEGMRKRLKDIEQITY